MRVASVNPRASQTSRRFNTTSAPDSGTWRCLVELAGWANHTTGRRHFRTGSRPPVRIPSAPATSQCEPPVPSHWREQNLFCLRVALAGPSEATFNIGKRNATGQTFKVKNRLKTSVCKGLSVCASLNPKWRLSKQKGDYHGNPEQQEQVSGLVSHASDWPQLFTCRGRSHQHYCMWNLRRGLLYRGKQYFGWYH